MSVGMVKIRSTSNVVRLGRKEGTKSSSAASSSSVSDTASPFAAKPVDVLKAITERKSRPLTEEQKLALLQNALKPFASEARGHLPQNLTRVEKKVRKRMIEEGFSDVLASEAGDETVSALLTHRVSRKKPG